jgi:unsaturated rhamnogalacturonyl hydrolase
MALVDLCELIDPSHEDYIFYARLLKEVIDNILTWQQPQGLWMQIMDQPDRKGNYLETSASAMFVYTLLKGRRLGILEEPHVHAGKKAFEGIVATQLREKDGRWKLEGICSTAELDDGKGSLTYRNGSYKYYISKPIIANNPKGVGAFMMARAEVLRQEDQK